MVIYVNQMRLFLWLFAICIENFRATSLQCNCIENLRFIAMLWRESIQSEYVRSAKLLVLYRSAVKLNPEFRLANLNSTLNCYRCPHCTYTTYFYAQNKNISWLSNRFVSDSWMCWCEGSKTISKLIELLQKYTT